MIWQAVSNTCCSNHCQIVPMSFEQYRPPRHLLLTHQNTLLIIEFIPKYSWWSKRYNHWQSFSTTKTCCLSRTFGRIGWTITLGWSQKVFPQILLYPWSCTVCYLVGYVTPYFLVLYGPLSSINTIRNDWLFTIHIRSIILGCCMPNFTHMSSTILAYHLPTIIQMFHCWCLLRL